MTAHDSERQALLPGAKNYPLPLRKPQGPLLRSDDLAYIAVLPWLTFTASAVGVGMVPQSIRSLTYFIGGACLLNALVFFCYSFDRKDRQAAAGSNCIGLLCMVALAAGWGVGMFTDGAYMDEYWRMRHGPAYDGVHTSGQGAEAYANATVLNFEKFTFVDTERTLGYMERGQVYCVAPVAGQAFSNSPTYFAVGMNCCDQRGNFKCSKADRNTVSPAGVVVRDNRSDAQFQTAIRVLESVYSMTPGTGNRTTVKFVGDADDYQASLLRDAIYSLFISSAVAAFIFVVVAVMLRTFLKDTPSRSHIEAIL